MKLDDAQKKKVVEWIEQGQKLSDIQKRLASELNVNLTYMEVRFLVDDLKLMPKDPTPPPAPAKAEPAPQAAPGQPEEIPADAEVLPEEEELPPGPAPVAGGGNVSVSVDQIARPGAMISGKVTFSDGVSAEWSLDQFGRLGLGGTKPGYKPSAGDVQSFQRALQTELQKMGF